MRRRTVGLNMGWNEMGAVYLLSAGLDSTVALAMYQQTAGGGIALTFDYGQRAAGPETERARKVAARFGIEHRVVSLPFLAGITNTSLVNRDVEIPTVEASELDMVLGKTLDTAEKVWVPNRNGLFVNIAAAFAESYGLSAVIAGFNAEEAATFPDNSPQFVAAATQALSYSTLNGVKLESPTQNLNKMEIVRLGLQLNIPWELVWSCYHGGEAMCGQCESCQRLKRALDSQQAARESALCFPASRGQ